MQNSLDKRKITHSPRLIYRQIVTEDKEMLINQQIATG